MGYTKEAIRGISWMAALRVSSRFLTLARVPILARLLTPMQHGTVGVAMIALSFVEILTETGINTFLIQENAKIAKYMNTAWVVSIARGFLIALIIIIGAPFVASFFHSPDSYPLLLLVSIVPILRGFINPVVIQFQKELRFDREFWFRFWIFLIDSLVAIALAFLTRSAASIVWGFIFGASLEVVLSFIIAKPTPRFAFEVTKLKKVLHRGKWITASGILDYAFRHGDDIVVGKMLPISSLGFYQNAYKISELPLTEVAVVASKVTFPVFAKISGDIKRLRRAFFRTIFGIAIVVIPIGVMLFLFPREIILLILGPQWVDAATALQALALFGVLRAIIGSVNVLFLASRKQEYVTLVTAVSSTGLFITIVPLVSLFGIVGAGVAATAGLLCSLPFVFYFTLKLLRRA